MQPHPLNRKSGHHPQTRAIARSSEEPLSDWALVSLLGGIYLGGLATFVGVAYAMSHLL